MENKLNYSKQTQKTIETIQSWRYPAIIARQNAKRRRVYGLEKKLLNEGIKGREEGRQEVLLKLLIEIINKKSARHPDRRL